MYEAVINQMTLDEKIGQMLCLACLSTEYDEQLKFLIEKANIGTIIHFARNVVDLKQIYELNKEIHKHSKYPMFIGLDHEGGMVRRVMNDITYLPGAMALNNASDEEAYEIYKQVGKELRLLGFNMNYMPSVDINNNPNNPVINSRSYSDEPKKVGKRGIIASKAMQDALVLPTAKHFPGHGNTSVDSHVGLPVVDDDLEQLMKCELVPFKETIDNGIDGIMISHILYKKIDDVYPASLSYNVITKLLKEKMNYKNLIITDSLTMAAIFKTYKIKEIIEKGINAGNDIIMFCGTANMEMHEEIIQSFKELINEGKITMERIDYSVKKIMMLKEKYKNSIGNNLLKIDDILSDLNEKKELSKQLTRRSITKVKDDNLLPFNKNEEILVLFPKIKLVTLVDNASNNLISLGGLLNYDEIVYEDDLKTFENIVQKSKKYDKILLATYNAKKGDYQTNLFDMLEKDKVVCVALRSPYDLLHLDGCKSYLCTYDCTVESIYALSEAIKENAFSVELPVNLFIEGEN